MQSHVSQPSNAVLNSVLPAARYWSCRYLLRSLQTRGARHHIRQNGCQLCSIASVRTGRAQGIVFKSSIIAELVYKMHDESSSYADDHCSHVVNTGCHLPALPRCVGPMHILRSCRRIPGVTGSVDTSIEAEFSAVHCAMDVR